MKDERKDELLNQIANVEYHPANLEEEYKLNNYKRVSLSNIATLGVALEPVATLVQNVVFKTNEGGTGIYRVTVPPNKTLVRFKDGRGFTGAISSGNNAVGGGQAILNPINFNPTMLFVAAAMSSINSKLDAIQETQKNILELLEEMEKAELRANLTFLSDIFNQYKYNWNNEKFINTNYIKVLDVKQASEKSILLNHKKVTKNIVGKSFLYLDQHVDKKLKEIKDDLKEYQLALYLYSFSSFLEVLLLENFESEFLNSITDKIEEYSFNYRDTYTNVFNYIEEYSKSSLQSKLSKAGSDTKKVMGKLVSKTPLSKSNPVFDTIKSIGDKVISDKGDRTELILSQLVDKQKSPVRPFIENINTINRIYNQPLELMFDNDNIYFAVE